MKIIRDTCENSPHITNTARIFRHYLLPLSPIHTLSLSLLCSYLHYTSNSAAIKNPSVTSTVRNNQRCIHNKNWGCVILSFPVHRLAQYRVFSSCSMGEVLKRSIHIIDILVIAILAGGSNV